MTPVISQGIVGAQVVLLAITVLLSFSRRGQTASTLFAWMSSVGALVTIGLAGAATATGGAAVTGSPSTFVQYGAIAVVVALLNWMARSVIQNYLVVREERRLESPKVRSRAGEELREILRREGIELDARLQQAEQERESFLYALEERHAKQIAGLAQEYQHEAHTILQQLLDQLAADRLHPMVEQRLAEHQQKIESELGAIDSAVAGETLNTLRAELAETLKRVDDAEARLAKIREENPDSTVEERVQARLDQIDGMITERSEATKAEFDATLAATIEAIEARIGEVGAMLDERVEAASNPLAARMAETEAAVERQLQEYLQVLSSRFGETEQILNARIIEQEQALEARVIEMETSIEERLGQHATAIEQVLGEHDQQLHGALQQQSDAIGEHFSAERDRLIAELSEHAVAMQERVAEELLAAEQRARETVEASQVAWNQFTGELEQRFAETREEALRAAQEIAVAERETLERELAQLTESTSSEIAERVESLGREAAWQRAQVERVVEETLQTLQRTAQEAVADADVIFADLDRIGAERVDMIRRQAEDALVQSRDYVGQLQESLGAHLDQLRERSTELAEEMNERLGAITAASQQTTQQLEAYSRQVTESTTGEIASVAESTSRELASYAEATSRELTSYLESSRHELAAVAEQHVQSLSQRIHQEIASNVQALVHEQQRTFDAQLGETAQRIIQQVNGDLAGLAEHARGAITGELEQMIAQSREQARQAQEQGYMQIMNELARQQQELAEQARSAAGQTQSMLDESLRENRRQLEEAMASMGAHMREELVRFHDEGQRRVEQVIEQLRRREHDMLREEDRKLSQARSELVRQHQGALEHQVRSMVGGLAGSLGSSSTASMQPSGVTLSAQVEPVVPEATSTPTAGTGLSGDVQRPATPLSAGFGQLGHDPQHGQQGSFGAQHGQGGRPFGS